MSDPAIVVEVDKGGMLMLALVLTALTAFCWWRVWGAPVGKNWMFWACCGCAGVIAALAAFATWSLLP